MEDPCQGKTLLKSDEAMQPMHNRETLHQHQPRTGNIKQTKRINFYMLAPTKDHSYI